MDVVEDVPTTLLGWPIKSRMQICFNWIIPNVLELLVYIILITADFAVTYQHFSEENHLYAGLTLSFICLPAFLTFCSIISSPQNWPQYFAGGEEEDDSAVRSCSQFSFHLICIFLVNVVIFPIGAMGR